LLFLKFFLATPILMLGLNGAPQAGDKFNVFDTYELNNPLMRPFFILSVTPAHNFNWLDIFSYIVSTYLNTMTTQESISKKSGFEWRLSLVNINIIDRTLIVEFVFKYLSNFFFNFFLYLHLLTKFKLNV